MTLATVEPDGQPLAGNLFVAAKDDLSLVFTAGARSRHSLALMAHPRAAVTVYRETWDWATLQGVQMEGRVEHLAVGPTREAAWRLFLEKFSFASSHADEISRSEFYRFVPRWVRLLDHNVEFGYRVEARLN